MQLQEFAQGQVVILLRAHKFNILLGVIVISDKMKKAVDDDTVQLILKFGPELYGIFTDRINTNEKVSGKTVSLTVIESYNIRKIIVLKILLIDVKHVIVRTENNRYIPYSTYFALGRKFQPLVRFTTVAEFEVSVLKII